MTMSPQRRSWYSRLGTRLIWLYYVIILLMNQEKSQPRQNVLFIITKSNWGGAQKYVFDLATNLPRERFEPVVLCGGAQGSEGAGELVAKLTQAGVRVIYIAELGRDLSIADAAAYRAIRSAFQTEKPDIVHLNSSKAGALGALAARGTRRIVFTAHGWPFAERRMLPWKAVAWLGSWVTALFSDTVICVSRQDLKLGQKFPFAENKCVLIHNGIDPSMQFGDG